MEIEIRPSHRSIRALTSYITVWDVLEGLYHGLREPITPQELLKFTPPEKTTIAKASEIRRRCVVEDRNSGHVARKIDYLLGRRHFLGIRLALGYELPEGRKFGEVFVVQVETVEG